jgi:hypothetical protein
MRHSGPPIPTVDISYANAKAESLMKNWGKDTIGPLIYILDKDSLAVET